jgi:hypothetical protein
MNVYKPATLSRCSCSFALPRLNFACRAAHTMDGFVSSVCPVLCQCGSCVFPVPICLRLPSTGCRAVCLPCRAVPCCLAFAFSKACWREAREAQASYPSRI